MVLYIDKSKNEQNQDEYSIHGLNFRNLSIILRALKLRDEIITEEFDKMEQMEISADLNEIDDNTSDEITKHLANTSDLYQKLVQSLDKMHNEEN